MKAKIAVWQTSAGKYVYNVRAGDKVIRVGAANTYADALALARTAAADEGHPAPQRRDRRLATAAAVVGAALSQAAHYVIAWVA